MEIDFEQYKGQEIGCGGHRTVYAHKDNPDIVIKVCTKRGGEQNKQEWKAWNLADELGIGKRWLAPCLMISKDGKYLVQLRGEKLESRFDIPAKIPDWLTSDSHRPIQWVKIDGNIVLCDYGDRQHIELEKMKNYLSKKQLASLRREL